MTTFSNNYNFTLYNTTFTNKSIIKNIDLCNVPYISNDMSLAFSNCQNLMSVVNINQNVTTMYKTYNYCVNLISVPNIPNSVTNMAGTFTMCQKVNSLPNIPNSVTNMAECFYGCYEMTNIPTIPSSVTNISGTFYDCRKLSTIPNLPLSITNMTVTFQNCKNVTGNIFIRSSQISGATNCFYDTTNTKNVYIPYTFFNGTNSATYNSFISAGYKSDGSYHGVYLKDINPYYAVNDTDYTITNSGSTVYLQKYIGSSVNVVGPKSKEIL